MAESLRVLLEGAAAAPDRPLAEIPLLEGAGRARVLEEWNRSATAYPRERSLAELFAEQAARAPEAAAVAHGGERLTYAELDRRSGALAGRLRRRGIGRGARVGVCMERGVELVVGVLAIVRAGAAYVPLDTANPPERLAFMADDAGVALLLTQSSLADRLPGRPSVVVDAGREEVGRESPEADAPGVSADDLAYVIYTSGSTGRPKGVAVPQRAVVRLVRGTDYLPFSAGDRAAQLSNTSFDAATLEIWGTLLNGGCLVVVDRDVSLSPPELAALFREERITWAFLTTALFNRIAYEVPDAFRPLRDLLFGGEAADPEAVRRVLRAGGPERLLHVYGPTECTTFAAWHPVRAVEEGARTLPIGGPLANTTLYVLDRGGEPVPVGAPGELLVGGDGVAWGYVGSPAPTAERFVPDPFSPAPGARLYRTGDRVRRRADGTLEFLGRIDQQVKVRGFRIEPGEVEAALLEHPGVERAVVVAREEQPGGRRLVGYFVPAPGAAPEAGGLRAWLRDRLPDYMVPAALVELEAVPLTANGKTDLRALPAPGWGAEPGRAHRAPSTPAEEALAAVWRGVLGAERIGVEDNFFELGGDSILAIQVVARARRAGLHLTPRQLFEHQTVAGLARVAGTEAPVDAEQGTVRGPVELTPIQAWFFARDLPERHHFNMSALLEARSPLEAGALAAAVAGVVAHHDALRMRFRPEADGWRQENAGLEGPAPFGVADLSALPEEAQRAALESASAALQRSLDLERGPLARFQLFARGEGRSQRLLVAAHHLVVDGVSWRILLEDLAAAYGQAAAGEAVSLPPKTTSFRRWAARLADHARSGGFDAELPFWSSEARREVAPLPVDFPAGRDADLEGSARSVAVSLDADETAALLHEVPRAYRTRIDDVLLTALARALAAWTGDGRVLVEMEGHGREELFPDADLSRTVGWFTAAYPVLLDVRGAPAAGDALRAVKEQLRAVPSRGIGHGALRWLGAEPARADLSALPRAEVSFNYLGQFDQVLAGEAAFALARESAGAALAPDGRRTHPLGVTGGVMGGRLQVRWSYGPALLRAGTVEGVSGRFLAELRGLIAHCTSEGAGGFTPSDFPLAGLDPARLDALAAAHAPLEDVYPLSPAQEGMLFHTLMEPGAYLGQLAFDLVGPLDAEAFAGAWQGVVDRHPALRTGFAWRGLERPLQVVRRRAGLELRREDWRGVPEAEREERFTAYLAADRARGFVVEGAPLMRLALFRTGEEEHRAVWTQHHLVLDGWSLPLVFREVAALYRAGAGEGAAELPPARPYRAYVAWLEGRDLGAAERFWREALRGFAGATPLGVDRVVRGEARGQRRVERRLSAERSGALQEWAAAHGLTVNTLVQGAWALVLARYSGEEDVVFGATVSGRPAEVEGVEEVVGLFINTLPVRVRVADEPVLPWLKRLQEWNLAMREHEYAPLARVQQWSGARAGEALFESILVFENYPMDERMGAGEQRLRVVPRAAANDTGYALTLGAVLEGRLTLRAEYDRSRLDEAAAGRILEHLERVLERMAADPAGSLAGIGLLDGAERTRLLVEPNAAVGTGGPGLRVHEAFSAQARLTPGAPALLHGGASLTYAELDRRADGLARDLRRRGVGREAPVAVLVDRSPEMVAAVLAVWKAGGAYLPLDPASPPERLAYLLEDSGVRLVIAGRGVSGALPPHAAELLFLDDVAAAGGEGPLPSDVAAEDLAYVIYTSGSTGRPKGVRVEHGSLSATLRAAGAAFGFGPGDVVPSIASFAFDIWIFETLLPLLGGASVRLVPRERVLDAGLLLEELEDATCLHAVPALMRQIARTVRERRGTLPAVRQTYVGGDSIPPDLLPEVREAFPRAETWAMYGPTEAAILCAGSAVGGEERGRHLIGAPMGNAAMYVLDAAGEPVPAGVPGELYLGGPAVARDYLGRPELTAEKFVPDPFSPLPARGCTAPATGRAGARTASWSSWGAPTTRSRSAGSASSPGRWSPCWRSTRTCARRW